MSTERDFKIIVNILKHARMVEELYNANSSKSAFGRNYATIYSAINLIHQISKDVDQLSEDYKKKHNHIKWSQIGRSKKNLEDRSKPLSLDELWYLVEEFIPLLHTFVEKQVTWVEKMKR